MEKTVYLPLRSALPIKACHTPSASHELHTHADRRRFTIPRRGSHPARAGPGPRHELQCVAAMKEAFAPEMGVTCATENAEQIAVGKFVLTTTQGLPG